ncbi:MAG TPA: hypothetical protein VMV73_04665 [Candidatus Dormibacteraeota bacterium]|nr:hypothetical protein [Candidatus Dormibacteraeota bacterium]
MQPLRKTRAAAALAFLAAFSLAIPAVSCPIDGARIVDTGSTNVAGFTMGIRADGTGWWKIASRSPLSTGAPHSFTIPVATATRLLATLADGRALQSKGVPCMKSASFGYSLFALWHGWRSPDIACPLRDASSRSIASAMHAVIAASGMPTLGPGHRVTLPTNEPRRQPIESSPAGSATPRPRRLAQ